MASVPPPAVEYGAGVYRLTLHNVTSLSGGCPTDTNSDEISALVLDPGFSVVRAGFAGEDAPKSVVPSHYGVVAPGSGSTPNYVFDDNAIHNPFSDLDIRNPMASDGTVDDWDVAAKLWEYTITSRLTVPAQKIIYSSEDSNGNGDVNMDEVQEQEKPLSENPLLMAEPSHNPAKNREKSIEIAMEDWGTPAFYLAKSGVLAGWVRSSPCCKPPN